MEGHHHIQVHSAKCRTVQDSVIQHINTVQYSTVDLNYTQMSVSADGKTSFCYQYNNTSAVVRCIVLCCIAYCTALHDIALHYTVLNVLYCIVP
jgi:hypothetical protein